MAKIKETRTILDGFSASQAASLSGLSLDMVNYLARNKIIDASGGGQRGRGRRRLYAYADILLLRIVAKLLANGISVLRLKKSIVAIRDRGGDTEALTHRFLVTDGQELYFQNGELVELLSSGQLAFAFVLELAAIRSDLALEMSSLLVSKKDAKQA